MQISPEHCTRHPGAGVQHVMMVVPVNADIYETQNIAEEHWQQRPQIFDAIAMRHLHLQHHNGDDNCDHSVTECLQASLRHLSLLTQELAGNLTRTRVFSEMSSLV